MSADLEINENAHGEAGHVHGAGCNHGSAEDHAAAANRNEKKAREIFAKLGMKPIAGIERVTIKRSKNVPKYTTRGHALISSSLLDDFCYC